VLGYPSTSFYFNNKTYVCDNILVALVSLELDRETSGITSRSELATDGGKSDGDLALLSLLKDICQIEILEGVCGFVGTVGS